MTISEKTKNLLKSLNSSQEGLSQYEAENRLHFSFKKQSILSKSFLLLYRNFSSPLILLLILAACFSIYFKDTINALIIFSIIFASCIISFIQELKALINTTKLISSMKMSHTVLRDSKEVSIPSESIVVGDVLCLDAGDLIPLDCQLIESTDIYVNESNITGEALPKEKHHDDDNFLKMGSYVVSGIGKAVIIPQDTKNNFSELLSYISRAPIETSFSQNLQKFSKFLMQVTLIFSICVLGLLFIFNYSPLQAFLFALSIAVGLSPQLLPAVLTTNLALGAQKMAQCGALTKKLESIEIFGNMDLLCCDKTGTLTKGKIEMYAALDSDGVKSDEVRFLGYINAFFQTGFHNSLDAAILEENHFDESLVKKLDEIPYDFSRKILSIYVKHQEKNLLISKGALEAIIDRCDLNLDSKKDILERANTFYSQGFRVLGLATKQLDSKLVSYTDEIQMSFKGFLLFYDPIKDDCKEVICQLKDLGIRLVMITGDHPLVASHVAKESGFENIVACESTSLDFSNHEQLTKMLNNFDVFARIEPIEKAKIISHFRELGFTVGFLGDGINDSGALYAADVGISVESGSDIAKATCDLILGKKQLTILVKAVKEGRKIFGNTIKYILMAVSANFGNMFSMALISLFLPFLPLLPTQILLINLLQDIPEMSISVDHVDPDVIKKPQKWDIKFIKKFMLVFGPLSSIFDFITFFFLLAIGASSSQFRSMWFTTSVLTATFVILFIRTKYCFYKCRPSGTLLMLVFFVIGVTLILPYTSLGQSFELSALSKKEYMAMTLIVASYVICVEFSKKLFYRKMLTSKNPA